jgi:endonuclease YncB( thermonuclease family)
VRQKLTSKAPTAPIPFCPAVFHLISPCAVRVWTGRAVGVAAGETIMVLNTGKSVEILLYGIDCPEEGQPFSDQTIQFVPKMVFGKTVEVYRSRLGSSGERNEDYAGCHGERLLKRGR